MRRSRRTKILATLGPSSSDPSTIEALFRAGADVFRINMSHTDHAGMRGLVTAIRTVEDAVGRPIGILADLQGPKLRLGVFSNGKIELEEGDLFHLDSDSAPGDGGRVQLPHPEILEALQPGHRLLIDDGRVKLTVEEMTSNGVSARVDVGGTISDRKGVSVPDTTLALSAMTEKDRRDLDAALEAKVDWVALSFIQRPDDLAEVRKIARGRVGVMAKIEKPQAIERLEDIIELSDALMVARGDLGVEMPVEKVPGLQKRITRAARKAGKPVVVATQMLESMITAPTPTRAEVSDVATAVFEGADAVMLSAESAAGKYPIEAVTTMDRIAYEVERDDHYMSIIAGQRSAPEATGADAIAAAARQIAETLNLSAIVCYTSSGATALRVARERPSAPLVVVSPVRTTARRLALAWGLHCVVSPDARDVDDMVDRACSVAFAEKFARPGQRLLTIAGSPFGTPGATNLLRVAYVSDDGRGGT
ncbi:pyruvate kinase [Amorphus orientalis]|uniref:Pyruvate kinase n=1 Tax=Amorphus orientalis TaxID=649198 RepID=A0AAE3VS45_9HYPH|nr:pyruvate kinase [Amorphus orientalis]MDQ0316810.1 pyruvate kinase [Amorphus orientalis]